MEANVRLVCWFAALSIGACGGSKTLRATSDGHSADLMFAGTQPDPSPPPPPAAISPSTVERAAVERVVDQGLGRFLQWVDIEPVHVRGAFAGFRLVALKHQALTGAGLVVGDVVTRLNGLPIGLPEEALEAWQRLRDAPEIVVDYRRQGVAQQLRLPIVD